ncbi:MAG: outer membrane lipoprotein carrier protein LolA [Nitrospirota bacterium]
MIFGFWIFLGLSPVSAFSESLQKTIQTLQETDQKINDIQADFTQEVTFEGFESSAKSNGKVFFKKDKADSRKMRWDYNSPSSQQIFIDGETLMQYTPQNQQVIRSVLGKQTGLPIDLFMGMEKIEQIFSIAQQEDRVLLLKPKKKGSNVIEMRVTLAPPPRVGGLFIQKVQIQEANGNLSEFIFKKLKINKDISDSTVSLKIPEGVEVIDLK